MRKVGALAVILLAPSISFANIENRNLMPFGETEGLMGNAGVAGAASTGSVFYNPAGLTLLTHPKISVSGSTYVSSSQSTDTAARYDNTNIPYSTSSFDSIPSSVIGTFQVGHLSMAYFVLVPEMRRLDNRQTTITPNTKTTIVEENQQDEMWLGIAAGLRLNSLWSIGFALDVIQSKDSVAQTIVEQFPSATNSITMNVDHLQASTNGLSATLGLLYEPTPDRTFGIKLQSPSFRL